MRTFAVASHKPEAPPVIKATLFEISIISPKHLIRFEDVTRKQKFF